MRSNTGITVLKTLVAACLALPSLAMAGGATVVVNLSAVTPPGAPPPPAPEAVPFMGQGMVFALGALLAVVAFRFLRHRKAYQKVLSIALLGAGVLTAGLGADRVSALLSVYAVPSDSPACSAGGSVALNTEESGWYSFEIENQCATTTLVIDSYLNLPCGPEASYYEVADGDVGDTIAPGATVTANFCND